MPGQITKEAFEQAYAKRSKVTVDWLHAHDLRGYSCECDYELCEGWAMRSTQQNRDIEARGNLTELPAGAMTIAELLGDDVAELIRHNKIPREVPDARYP